jgi:hypothetical protein
MTKTRKPKVTEGRAKPRAIAVGFFYSSVGPRRDVLRLEIDLKGVSFKARRLAVDRVMRLAERYDFISEGGDK